MKKLRFLSMCMAMCLLGTSLCCATTEADSSVVPNELEKKNAFIDIQHHWAANDIYTLTENHIINGFPNDRFKPSQTLTRAQLAQILYKLEGIRDNNDGVEIGSVEATEKIEGIIKDEIPTWASEAIEWAIINRVMFLYEDEEFKSDVHVDRAMIANAIYNYLKYTEYSFKELTPSALTDIDDSVNKMAIETLYNEGIIHGYAEQPDKEFTVLLEVQDQTLTIQVSDTGVGISDIAQAMLQAFSTRAEHMGLGFAFMQTFMDSVEVVSSPGEGTTVTMYKQLPLVEPLAEGDDWEVEEIG